MKKTLYSLLLVSAVTFLFATVASAAPQILTAAPATPNFMKGIPAFFTWATNWMYGVIPVTGGAVFGWNAWQRSHAEDQDSHMYNKRMKAVLKWTPIALGGNAVINLFLHFLT